MRYELNNGCISVEIDSHGAEIKSIQKKRYRIHVER